MSLCQRSMYLRHNAKFNFAIFIFPSRARVPLNEVVLTFNISISRDECSTSQLTGLLTHYKATTHKDSNSPNHKLTNSSNQNSKAHQLKPHQLKSSSTQTSSTQTSSTQNLINSNLINSEPHQLTNLISIFYFTISF